MNNDDKKNLGIATENEILEIKLQSQRHTPVWFEKLNITTKIQPWGAKKFKFQQKT